MMGVRGNKGDEGSRGSSGPPGIKGVKGEQGSKGEKGEIVNSAVSQTNWKRQCVWNNLNDDRDSGKIKVQKYPENAIKSFEKCRQIYQLTFLCILTGRKSTRSSSKLFPTTLLFCTKTVFSAFLTGLLIQQAAVWYSYLSLIPAAHKTVWKIIWSIEAYILEINSVIRKQ